MRAFRRTALILSVLLAPAASAQNPKPVDRVAGWRSDIAWWLDQVRAQHYVYRSKPLPAPLVKAAAALSRNVGQYSDDRMLTRPWIPIDLPVELSSADYFGGKDPVLTAALEAIRSGSHRRGRW